MSDEVYGRARENVERTQNEAERIMRENAERAVNITEQVMKDQIQRTAELATSGLTIMRHVTEYNAKLAHNIGDCWQQFIGNSINEVVRHTQRFSERAENITPENERSRR